MRLQSFSDDCAFVSFHHLYRAYPSTKKSNKTLLGNLERMARGPQDEMLAGRPVSAHASHQAHQQQLSNGPLSDGLERQQRVATVSMAATLRSMRTTGGLKTPDLAMIFDAAKHAACFAALCICQIRERSACTRTRPARISGHGSKCDGTTHRSGALYNCKVRERSACTRKRLARDALDTSHACAVCEAAERPDRGHLLEDF